MTRAMKMGLVFGCSVLIAATGCSGGVTSAKAPSAPAASPVVEATAAMPDEPVAPKRAAATNTTWVGSATEGEVIGWNGSSSLGVWVDAPEGRTTRPAIDIALVIDVSGSMQGEKITSARAAAKEVLRHLRAGDIVSLVAFSDSARTLISPTAVDAQTLRQMNARIDHLEAAGGTNMMDGIQMSERLAAEAPKNVSVRRVVLISDGRATVGATSAEALGALAEVGARHGIQVTSLGVGTDYDEKVLNSLAVQSTGRMYHLGEPKEMVGLISKEVELLESTVASNAYLEIVPGRDVQLVGAPGLRSTMNGESLRIPLGVLYAGQHREALVQFRGRGGSAPTDQVGVASVRLHYTDPTDNSIERVQEVVPRVTFSTDDHTIQASTKNFRTQSIMALFETGSMQVAAAQAMNDGDFSKVDSTLSAAQTRLEAQARATKDVEQKKRLEVAANNIARSRSAPAAAAAMPAPARRAKALEMNSQGMRDVGF